MVIESKFVYNIDASIVTAPPERDTAVGQMLHVKQLRHRLKARTGVSCRVLFDVSWMHDKADGCKVFQLDGVITSDSLHHLEETIKGLIQEGVKL
jgi:hypothetical protein